MYNKGVEVELQTSAWKSNCPTFQTWHEDWGFMRNLHFLTNDFEKGLGVMYRFDGVHRKMSRSGKRWPRGPGDGKDVDTSRGEKDYKGKRYNQELAKWSKKLRGMVQMKELRPKVRDGWRCGAKYRVSRRSYPFLKFEKYSWSSSNDEKVE